MKRLLVALTPEQLDLLKDLAKRAARGHNGRAHQRGWEQQSYDRQHGDHAFQRHSLEEAASCMAAASALDDIEGVKDEVPT